MRKSCHENYLKNRAARLKWQHEYTLRKGMIVADKSIKMAKVRISGCVYLMQEWVKSNPHLSYQTISDQMKKMGTWLKRG